jgi:hypothetical protein
MDEDRMSGQIKEEKKDALDRNFKRDICGHFLCDFARRSFVCENQSVRFVELQAFAFQDGEALLL